MRIDDRTAIRMARRMNDISMPLVMGRIGDNPEHERRVCRIMRWLGDLYTPLVPWVLNPSMDLPDPGERMFRRGGII